MGVDVQSHAPAALPRERDPVPIVQEADSSQGRSGRLRKFSPSPGFDLWTFHFSHPAILGIQRINCFRISYEFECVRTVVPNLFPLVYPWQPISIIVPLN